MACRRLLLRGGTEQAQQLAAELWRVLRPGGRLVMVLGVQAGMAQYLKAPGLRWRISYKVLESESGTASRDVRVFTFAKPRD